MGASDYFGFLSICCWILCIVPQFVINCKNKQRTKLSPYLFIQWFLGDSLNLIGSFLTGQLLFQQISAIFYVVMDILNIFQYWYFSRALSISDEDDASEESEEFIVDPEDPETVQRLSISVRPYSSYFRIPNLLLITSLLLTPSEGLLEIPYPLIDWSSSRWSSSHSLIEGSHSYQIVGLVCGICAGFLYIGSRIIQLRKIYLERSTEGLLISMFIFAILGNTTYLTALFLKSTELAEDQISYLINAGPWIICSSIVMIFDFIILYHFWLYN